MSRAFADIAFTPEVRAAQAAMGSRDIYRDAWSGAAESVQLGQNEIDFIRARDSLYQATLGSNGWPYVQHRGGPPGFLKVLGPTTIGYADYSGNRQYISVGNLSGDDRVSLILVDYPAQRRLKIWGRARLVDTQTEAPLIARLESPDYRARVERGIVIEVSAFDWNCPKHITPRLTEREWMARATGSRLGPDRPEPVPAARDEVGAGDIHLVVAGIRQLTPRVRAYELRNRGVAGLPVAPPGSHLTVPVRLPDGEVVARQYSLLAAGARHECYEIAVQNEESGRGGSGAIHAGWDIGTQLAAEAPAQHFSLHQDARPALLLAGGIGITAIQPMAHELQRRGNRFELHYSARSPAEMAFMEEIAHAFPGQAHLYFTRAPDAQRCDFLSLLRAAPLDSLCYVCGPRRYIEAVSEAAHRLRIPATRVRYESFD